MPADPASAAPLAIVVDYYPDFAAPHVAHLIKLLEARGHACSVWSLHGASASGGHRVQGDIAATVHALPGTLTASPFRTIGPTVGAVMAARFLPALMDWGRMMMRLPSPAAFRSLGQACVLRSESAAPFFLAIGLTHAGAVAQLAARLCGNGWAVMTDARADGALPEAETLHRLQSAAFCLADSEAAARVLRRHAPGAERVGVAPPCVDLAVFVPPLERGSPRTGETADSAVRLVSIGDLEPAQGYRDLVVALADMPKATHWRLTHIGRGSLAGKLREFAHGLRLHRQIDWCGPRDHAGVLKALREADIFVQSPRSAKKAAGPPALPHAVVEAASQCLPIVSTRHASLGEFLSHETSGLLVRAGRIADLTEAIHRLCRDPGERMRLGQAARQRVEAAHDMAAVADDLSRRLKRATA